ncbi:TetR/AcrR family transcriptional regulator, partial [Pseudomonas sp. AOB-7]
MAGACAETRLETLRGKALALFAERGFAQVGMRELALHLGMAAGSLYHHFESKEQLLFELIEEL